jgi:hypothetical protein
MLSSDMHFPVGLANVSKGQHKKERKDQGTGAETPKEIKNSERSQILGTNPLLAVATLAPRAPGNLTVQNVQHITELRNSDADDCKKTGLGDAAPSTATVEPHDPAADPLIVSPLACRTTTICTWNTTALFGIVNDVSRERILQRERVLQRLLANTQTVALQEVHGGPGDVEILRARHPGYMFLGSFCQSSAMGGVLTILDKRIGIILMLNLWLSIAVGALPPLYTETSLF